jgi:ferredoxin-type protein NapH
MRVHPGADAVLAHGWLAAHRWLIARRTVQLGILALFLAGPVAGWWVVKGNLNFSYTLGFLPLQDPYVLLQSLAARHLPEAKALIGGAIVLGLYLLVGGRVYCSWVCPVNPVTDAAAWLRRRLGLTRSARLSPSTRHWLLAMTIALAALTGTIAWELVNPVSILHRGLIFGMGAAWAVVLAVILFDVFVADRGWCGHLCPVGAFYGLLGRMAVLRVVAVRRASCNDCADCYAVCPEPKVIKPALKGEREGRSPVIQDAACTNCARCIDVCSKDVFAFATRFHNPPSKVIPLTVHQEAP